VRRIPPEDDFFAGAQGWEESGSDKPTATVRPRPTLEEGPPPHRTFADDVSRLGERLRERGLPSGPWLLIGAGSILLVLVAGILWLTGGDEETQPRPRAGGIVTGAETGADTDTGAVPLEPEPEAQVADPVPEDLTLRTGASGEAVTALQAALAALGYDIGDPDGIYGERTSSVVTAFQAAAGLEADGVVGPQTAQAINEALSGRG
jgi:hypothetical protein